MRWPSRRMLPSIIGVSVAATLVADVAVALSDFPSRPALRHVALGERYIAAAEATGFTPAPTAPFQKQVVPHVLIAAPRTIPADVVDKIRRTTGVKAVEVVDAARAFVAGKRAGVLGVDPSTFRAYTPSPSARSDALWRNVASGDVAISFTMGQDGGVPLGSMTKIGGQSHQVPVRVGAYATMGISEVDAVISHAAAHAIGMPSANGLLVNAPNTDLAKLRQTLSTVLPHDAKSAVLQSGFDGTTTPGGNYGQVPRGGNPRGGTGNILTVAQVISVIRAAQSQLGVPYVWGGEAPGRGFDCSGLVQWAFGQVGIKMPRTADIQAFTGWRLPYGNAQPGDLLTWKNDPTFNGVSHIGIYVGNNMMIVARHEGTLIQYQVPYMQNFWGAIRVNPQLAAQIANQ